MAAKWQDLGAWAQKRGELPKDYTEKQFESLVRWAKRVFGANKIRRLRKGVYEIDTSNLESLYKEYSKQRDENREKKQKAALALVAENKARQEFDALFKAAEARGVVFSPQDRALLGRNQGRNKIPQFTELVNKYRAQVGLPPKPVVDLGVAHTPEFIEAFGPVPPITSNVLQFIQDDWDDYYALTEHERKNFVESVEASGQVFPEPPAKPKRASKPPKAPKKPKKSNETNGDQP